MESHPSNNHRNRICFAFNCACLCLLVFVSACSRKPNLIPYGYEDIEADEARESSVARVDYPIVHLVDPNAATIQFRVSKNGERMWIWSGDFWREPMWNPPKWYRVNLITPGDSQALCNSWQQPDGKGDITLVPCNLTVNGKLGKPMIAILDYWLDEKKPTDTSPPTGTLSRVYYLISEQY